MCRWEVGGSSWCSTMAAHVGHALALEACAWGLTGVQARTRLGRVTEQSRNSYLCDEESCCEACSGGVRLNASAASVIICCISHSGTLRCDLCVRCELCTTPSFGGLQTCVIHIVHARPRSLFARVGAPSTACDMRTRTFSW